MRRVTSLPKLAEVCTAASIIFGLTALGAAHGGYFPTAWGWSSVITLWIALTALALRPGLALSKAQLVTLGGIAGLTAWTFASVIWSSNVTDSVLEGERSIVYLGILAAGIFAIPAYARHVVPGSVLVAISMLAGWGVLTRTFPDRMGYSLNGANARFLLAPLGYHGAEGAMAAMGLTLALGMVCRGRWGWRVLAAAAVPMLALTLILTLSRGGVATFIIGYGVMLVFEQRRLRLLATTFALLPSVAAVVWASAHSQQGWARSVGNHTASADHRLAAAVVAGMFLAAATAGALALADAYWTPGMLPRRLFIAAVASLALFSAFVFFGRYGTPFRVYRSARHALTALPPGNGGGGRVTTLSLTYRNLLWGVARDGFLAHPVVGSGAGTFGQHWYRERPVANVSTSWAHSLYLGVASDLGVVGLALVAVLLAAPLAAAVRGRSDPAIAAAVGAYAGFLVHTGADWDWQLPAATAPALLLAVFLIGGSRTTLVVSGAVRIGLGVAFVAALAIAVVGWQSNRAIDTSAAQLRSGNWTGAAQEARTARAWAPWSYQAWAALGQAESGAGHRSGAERAYTEGIARACGVWDLWLDEATVATGAERSRALGAALWLNPLGHQVYAAIAALHSRRDNPVVPSNPCDSEDS